MLFFSLEQTHCAFVACNSKGVTVAFIYRYHSQDRTRASEHLLGERLAFVFPVVGVRVHVLVNALDAHTCT